MCHRLNEIPLNNSLHGDLNLDYEQLRGRRQNHQCDVHYLVKLLSCHKHDK